MSERKQRKPMFIVRVDFRNGLHLEYNFAGGADGGLGRAERCHQDIAGGMLQAREGKPSVCSVFDDAGRKANLDCAEMIAVALVPLNDETVAAIRIKQHVTEIAMEEDPDAFRQAQPQYTYQGPGNGAEPPPPLPAIGGQPQFQG